MPKYLVRQRRPMWVCFVQEIEAEDQDEAIETFHVTFDPQYSMIENEVALLDRGPIKLFSQAEYPDPLEIIDEG